MILAGVIALAVVVLIAVIGVLVVKNRKPEPEETTPQPSASQILSSEEEGDATDVMDMPFTTGERTVAQTNPDETVPADNAASVHVAGIDAFALYEYDETTGMRVRRAKHESTWTRGQDIVSLEAFASDTENIVLTAGGGRAWYDTWRSYWQQETASENCRIGYRVTFDLKNGETIDKTLLKPGDELSYRAYLENYLYDDAANADAGWYSHLEPDDLSDDMLLTSIKFTPGEQFEEIDGKITVTAFVYDALENFDYDGNYIGDVTFTTEIINR